MRLLCDVDGVLCDFIGAVCEIDGEAVPDDFIDFDLISGLKTQKRLDWVEEAVNHAGFCYRLRPYEGTQSVLLRLKEIADDLVFLTSPWENTFWHSERSRWLHYIAGAKPSQIVFAHSVQKQFVRGDLLIEDRLSTALAWKDKNSNGSVFLVARPWNGNVVESEFCTLKGRWL